MENVEPKHLTIDELARMIASGFADIHEQFGALESHVGDLGSRIDQHRQEAKDGFAGLHRIIGGMSHTLADHEERIKELEGE